MLAFYIFQSAKFSNSSLGVNNEKASALKSSIVNYDIRVFLTFFAKRLHAHKKRKSAHKRTKTKKAVLNALKNI